MLMTKSSSTNSLSPVLLLLCVVLLVLRLIVAVVSYSSPPPSFPWADSKIDPKVQSKPVMYFFVDSQNIASRLTCDFMERSAFGNREIVAFVKDHFLPVRVDLKGSSNSELSKAYMVESTPAVIVALPSGRRVKRSSGFHTDRATLEFLRSAGNRVDYQQAMDLMQKENFAEAAPFMHKFREHADDESDRAYSVLYEYVCLKNQKSPDAEKLIASVDQIFKNDKLGEWPRVLVKFLAGKLTEKQMEAKSKELVSSQTELEFVLGMKAYWNGDMKTAMKHLRWVSEKGDKYFIEYDLALPLVKRFEKEYPEAQSDASTDTSREKDNLEPYEHY